jgi:IS5 family transposase
VTRSFEQGTTPEDWKKRPSKDRQKDKDARWTKKHGRSFFGYKNHVNADARHKLIREYGVTDASVHDSQAFDDLLNEGNTSSEVYARQCLPLVRDGAEAEGAGL